MMMISFNVNTWNFIFAGLFLAVFFAPCVTSARKYKFNENYLSKVNFVAMLKWSKCLPDPSSFSEVLKVRLSHRFKN